MSTPFTLRRVLFTFAAFVCTYFAIGDEDQNDRRTPDDNLIAASFNRSDGSDRSSYARAPTVTATTFASRVSTYNGTSAWISYPDAAELRPYPLTVCFWFNMQGNDQVQYSSIVDKYSTGSANGWQIWVDTSERVHAWYFGVSVSNCIYGGGDGLLFTPSSYKTAAWQHCAVVFAIGGGEIFINGASVDTQGWTGTPTASTSTHRLGIGQHNLSGSTYYKGDLDDLRIFNRALSSTEIAALYSEGLGVTRP